MQQAGERLRVAGDVQVGPADVADQQRVAGEHQPRLLVAAPSVGDDVGVMRGRVPRRRDSADDRVAELDVVAVSQRNVVEIDASALGQIGGRSGRLHQRRQARDVVSLHVRLEDGDDWCADALGFGEVGVDKLDVRVDDRELAERERQPNR